MIQVQKCDYKGKQVSKISPLDISVCLYCVSMMSCDGLEASRANLTSHPVTPGDRHQMCGASQWNKQVLTLILLKVSVDLLIQLCRWCFNVFPNVQKSRISTVKTYKNRSNTCNT